MSIYTNIPVISDDVLKSFPLKDDGVYVKYIVEEQIAGEHVVVTNEDPSMKMLFVFLSEKYPDKQVKLHGVKGDKLYIYDIHVNDSIHGLDADDRDDVLNSFYLDPIPVLFSGNINKCVAHVKKIIGENINIPGLIIRSMNGKYITQIPNSKYIQKQNEDKLKAENQSIMKKQEQRMEYLIKHINGYFNGNRLSNLSNKIGKITPNNRNKFIELLCKDVISVLTQDVTFTTKYGELPENLQSEISKKYNEFATQLVDSYLQRKKN
jgi:hypothetical protein